jgi:5-hydroxyisourate hydrolase
VSGRLTTHVLDTSRGVPAAGMRFELFRYGQDRTMRVQIAAGYTNEDGRSPTPLIEGRDFQCGAYVLEFDVSDYHVATGQLPEHPFLGVVSIAFTISDKARHLHLPLLVSPFGYTTYRGS